MAYCKGCLEKQLRIDELAEENKRLKQQLRYRERKEEEGYFGASTPSSKRPVKETTPEENREKKGGGVPGHAGHGRPAHTEETADKIIDRDAGDVCPDCGGPLIEKEVRNRTVIEAAPARPEKLLYRLHHKICTNCRKEWRAKVPSVLPKSLYGNEITAQTAVMHYIHGIPMGRITEMTGVPWARSSTSFTASRDTSHPSWRL